MTRRAEIAAGILLILVLLPGCSSLPWESGSRSKVLLDEAQSCAVGHDLARTIAGAVSARANVLVSPKGPTPCEQYSLHYLRRAGFAIDPSGRSPTFDVNLQAVSDTEFQATASIGPTIQVSRIYVRGDGGVYPVSPASVIRHASQSPWRAPLEHMQRESGS